MRHVIEFEVWAVPPGGSHSRCHATFEHRYWQFALKCRARLREKGYAGPVVKPVRRKLISFPKFQLWGRYPGCKRPQLLSEFWHQSLAKLALKDEQEEGTLDLEIRRLEVEESYGV